MLRLRDIVLIAFAAFIAPNPSQDIEKKIIREPPKPRLTEEEIELVMDIYYKLRGPYPDYENCIDLDNDNDLDRITGKYWEDIANHQNIYVFYLELANQDGTYQEPRELAKLHIDTTWLSIKYGFTEKPIGIHFTKSRHLIYTICKDPRLINYPGIYRYASETYMLEHLGKGKFAEKPELLSHGFVEIGLM